MRIDFTPSAGTPDAEKSDLRVMPTFEQMRASLEMMGFRDITELGRGNMGIVFKVTDPGLERELAVKIVTNVDAIRVMREAQAMHDLAEPLSSSRCVQIRTIVSPGKEHQFPVIVMELQKGPTRKIDPPIKGVDCAEGKVKSLSDWMKVGEELRKRDDFSENEWFSVCVPIFYSLADLVNRIQISGYLHRDLKPSNIFVRKEIFEILLDLWERKINFKTAAERIKDFPNPLLILADLGTAKKLADAAPVIGQKTEPNLTHSLIDSPPVSPRHTVYGDVIGTPEFMPPQVLNGFNDDPLRDWYAAVLTMASLWIGNNPVLCGADGNSLDLDFGSLLRRLMLEASASDRRIAEEPTRSRIRSLLGFQNQPVDPTFTSALDYHPLMSAFLMGRHRELYNIWRDITKLSAVPSSKSPDGTAMIHYFLDQMYPAPRHRVPAAVAIGGALLATASAAVFTSSIEKNAFDAAKKTRDQAGTAAAHVNELLNKIGPRIQVVENMPTNTFLQIIVRKNAFLRLVSDLEREGVLDRAEMTSAKSRIANTLAKNLIRLGSFPPSSERHATAVALEEAIRELR